MLPNPTADATSLDAAMLRRLMWRARRGLLENDLILDRFLNRYGRTLSPAERVALQALLELDDNALLDVLLERRELPHSASNDAQRRVLQLLRTV